MLCVKATESKMFNQARLSSLRCRCIQTGQSSLISLDFVPTADIKVSE